jgi:peroxiredoxin
MPERISVGDEAPNFDLSSSEGVMLMLRDEVPRSPVLLFFVPDATTAGDDLDVCAGLAARLAKARAKLLVVSESALAELQEIQQERRLPFPLLHDDRGFSKQYGSGDAATKALFLIDREQRVAWLQRQPENLEEALREALAVADKMPSPTEGYPRSVINRLVDRWVN